MITDAGNGLNGTAELDDQTGMITFTPADGFTRRRHVRVHPFPTGTARLPARSTVTVTANTPPTAAADAAVTNANTPVEINSADLLANDTDPDIDHGDVLVITAVQNATHGQVELNDQTGMITFTPDTDFTGDATFEYTLSDGHRHGNRHRDRYGQRDSGCRGRLGLRDHGGRRPGDQRGRCPGQRPGCRRGRYAERDRSGRHLDRRHGHLQRYIPASLRSARPPASPARRPSSTRSPTARAAPIRPP